MNYNFNFPGWVALLNLTIALFWCAKDDSSDDLTEDNKLIMVQLLYESVPS